MCKHSLRECSLRKGQGSQHVPRPIYRQNVSTGEACNDLPSPPVPQVVMVAAAPEACANTASAAAIHHEFGHGAAREAKTFDAWIQTRHASDMLQFRCEEFHIFSEFKPLVLRLRFNHHVETLFL